MMQPGPSRPVGPLCLSVIVPCFNYRDFVARAIESVLKQDDRRCELIVVDDGSTDGSWEVISRYGLSKSFRIANAGMLRACCHALAHVDAPFVLFLDADDELAPGSLSRIIPRLDPGVAKLHFALTPIDAHGAVLGAPFPDLDDRKSCALRREVLATGVYRTPPTSGNVLRRDLCEVLPDVDYETAVDGVVLFVAPFLGEVVSIPDSLGFYRLHSRNASQSGSRPTASRFQIEADRFLLRHEHLRRLLARQGLDANLVDGTSAFFYRERRLYQAILEDRRPRCRDIAALHRLSMREDGSTRHKLSMILLLWLLFVLPQKRSKALLGYRIKLGYRSFWGMLGAVMARSSSIPHDDVMDAARPGNPTEALASRRGRNRR